MMEMKDWTAVEAEVRHIIASEMECPFTAGTVAQVADFLRVARDRCPVADVGKGFWSTICFDWINTPLGRLEIEVFEDRFEIYRFHEGGTDIRYVDHIPGTPLPADLLAELPTNRASNEAP